MPKPQIEAIEQHAVQQRIHVPRWGTAHETSLIRCTRMVTVAAGGDLHRRCEERSELVPYRALTRAMLTISDAVSSTYFTSAAEPLEAVSIRTSSREAFTWNRSETPLPSL